MEKETGNFKQEHEKLRGMRKEAEKIRKHIEQNEPNQLTNDTGDTDRSPLNDADYGYNDDKQNDFDIS